MYPRAANGQQIKIDLPYKMQLRDYQWNVWKYFIRPEKGLRGLTVWPRKNGKDLIALNIAIVKSLQRVGLIFYVAPFYKQVREIIWEGMDVDGRRFLDYIPRELITGVNNTDMRVRLEGGSQLKLAGSDNKDSIVGPNPVGMAFTEYSLQKPQAWDYLRPNLTNNGGWALFNGTTRGLNHMWQMYKKNLTNPRWFVEYLTRDDTGYPTLEAIAADREDGMPESLIQQEYYCQWTASEEEVLIPLDIIEPAIERQVDWDHVNSSPRIMGADIAFAEKGDKAVIARRQGSLLHPLEKHQGKDNMAMAARISWWIREWRPQAVFIDAGRGEGVISRLAQLGHEDIVIPVNFGGKTFNDLYMRKNHEMWGNTKDWFASVEHPPTIEYDEELMMELSAPKFWLNSRSYIEIESKKQLRARGIPSTNCADAVILTFAEDVEYPSIVTPRLARMGITPEIAAMLDSMTPQQYDMWTHMEKYADSYSPPGFN